LQVEHLEARCLPTVFVVSSGADSGAGTLRAAIEAANVTPGPNTIKFDAGEGGVDILLFTPLPTITNPVTIDGTTEPGYQGTPIVDLSASSILAKSFTSSVGLQITAGNCTVRGLAIHDFPGSGPTASVGIELSGHGGNVIAGCYIGVDLTGVFSYNVQETGILIDGGSSNNTIGGIASGDGNVISANLSFGVFITDNGTKGNQILGNKIGTDPTGAQKVGYQDFGIAVRSGAGDTTIGGIVTPARNVISGNLDGIEIDESTGNQVLGNFIGLDAGGSHAIPNGVTLPGGGPNGAGIELGVDATDNLIGGIANGAGNAISGNVVGVLLSDGTASKNTIQGNFVGTDALGATALGNGTGIYLMNSAASNLIGGTSVGAGNVVSGNDVGIAIEGPDDMDKIEDNLIGTDVSGEIALFNHIGVALRQGASQNAVQGNLVSANQVGIAIEDGEDNQLAGNLIGLDRAGLSALPNGVGIQITGNSVFNTVGGNTATARNVISGNQTGILLQGNGVLGTVIEGNRIGTNIIGTAAIGNQDDGVDVVLGATNTQIGGTMQGDGNLISGNGGDGIRISGGGTLGTLILANRIGTDQTATQAIPNGQNGIEIANDASGSVIGGSGFGGGSARHVPAGNVISGNHLDGILITSGAFSNLAVVNLIGTDGTGAVALGNGANGVAITNCAFENEIGGPRAPTLPGHLLGASNVISGNSLDGVVITDSGSTDNLVEGNFIGLAESGKTAVPNNGSGVHFLAGASQNSIGATDPNVGNVISGNQGDGAALESDGNKVQGNLVGTDVTGSAALANAQNGIRVTGADNQIGGGNRGIGRNVISGNGLDGVLITGTTATANAVMGNVIGTNAKGQAVLANGQEGVAIVGGASSNRVGGAPSSSEPSGNANLISGNGADGVRIDGTGTTANTVQGNKIGTNLSGAAGVANHADGVLVSGGASGNLIGGPMLLGNVISGNGSNGVELAGETTGNSVQGNRIGVNAAGTSAVANVAAGVALTGGASQNSVGGPAGAGNLISGNHGDGVLISGEAAQSNVVQANRIGTNAAAKAIPNAQHGIDIVQGASHNLIGGNASSNGNIIAFNGSTGVLVSVGTGNAILSNVIHGNTNGGIGLVSGGNQSAAAPTITAVIITATQTHIAVDLASTAFTTFTLEFFANGSADPSGFGQGAVLVLTDTLTTDAAGHANGVLVIPTKLPSGLVLAATATDADGNTSAFSKDVTVS
jgi:parallel beta-helix repeat protein